MPNLFWAMKARKKKVAEWNKTPEYRAASDAFLKKHPWCEVWLAVGIKVKATVVHHPNGWSYSSFELYCDLENNGAIAVSGKIGGGHYACHHSLKICPICKAKKCNEHAEGCQSCLRAKYPKLAIHLDNIVRDRKDRANVSRKAKRAYTKFPCSRRLKDQKCRDKKIQVCQYSAKTACNCDSYKEKVQG